ncbi:MAG: uridine phosphorylase [Nocardioidaceae bacterium]
MSVLPPVPPTRYALLPGDPGRVRRLLEHMEDTVVTQHAPPFVEAVGRVDGAPVLVAATGMGGPSVAVRFNQLAERGVDTFLRVGGAGPVAHSVAASEIVVASGAVRHEGASTHALPLSWPAVADPDLVDALLRAASSESRSVRCGVLHTKDSFFGEVDPASSPIEQELRTAWRSWQRLDVLASEMEASVLFCLATKRGLRAGAVVKVNDVGDHDGSAWTDDWDLCHLAVAGMAEVMRGDRA